MLWSQSRAGSRSKEKSQGLGPGVVELAVFGLRLANGGRRKNRDSTMSFVLFRSRRGWQCDEKERKDLQSQRRS